MDALPDLIVATIGALLTDVRDRCGLAVALCRNAPHLMVLSQDIPYCVREDGLARRIDAVLRTCPKLNDLVISFPFHYDEARVALLANARDRIGRRPRVRSTIGMAWLAHVDVIDIGELYVFDDAPLPLPPAVPTAIINFVNFRERVRQVGYGMEIDVRLYGVCVRLCFCFSTDSRCSTPSSPAWRASGPWCSARWPPWTRSMAPPRSSEADASRASSWTNGGIQARR